MFIHLHVHSHYSFLDSTLRIEEIVAAARHAKMDAVALTDTNGLYAVVPFIKACREAGVRPIFGAEINGFDAAEVASRLQKERGGRMKAEGGRREADFGLQIAECGLVRRSLGEGRLRKAEGGKRERGEKPEASIQHSAFSVHSSDRLRVVVLARDRVGYAELSRLVTQRRLAEPCGLQISDCGLRNADCGLSVSDSLSPLASEVCFSPGPRFEGTLLDALLALSEEHVWILTDSPALLRLLARKASAGSRRRNVFAELILTPRRQSLCRRLYDLARELRIPLVAAADVHFARRDDYSLYRLLRAIGLQKTIETLEEESQAGSLCHHVVDEEHYFKTAEEMARAFRGLRAPLRNTRYIAERCNLDLALGDWKFPRVTLSSGETAFSHLWKVTFDGLKQHYRPLTPEATRRLEYELEIIARLGFCEYFLAVNEIAQAARQRGYLFLGRGSAANSIVSFALGLTPVDPIRHNLYFERFLNPERRSPPDIDLDFSWKERDAVVRWVFDHFGHDRVALISTHITLQPRQAIREVAKAMGVAEAEVSRFTRPIPGWLGEGEQLADLPEVFPECRSLPMGDEPWKTIIANAQRLLDFPRHLSIHCGGLLITPDPITDYTPLQRAAKGPIITQMEMHAIEDLGLIKIDILGNRSLGVLTDCLRTLEATMKNGQRVMNNKQPENTDVDFAEVAGEAAGLVARCINPQTITPGGGRRDTPVPHSL